MTRHKFFKRLLPIILSAMLLFSALPVSASANDESTNEVASKIVREVVELREESVKHFLCEDGSYIAATYSQPVHYQKNGEWLEINNSLKLSSQKLSAAGKSTYSPQAADTAVSIPQSFAEGQRITAESKGHTISFGVAATNQNADLAKTAFAVAADALPSSSSTQLLGTAEVSAVNAAELNEKTATVDIAEPELSEAEQYNLDVMAVDNQAGAVVFEDVFPNCDLEYIVNSNSIKENIVVYQPQSEYIYSFDFDTGGLTPVTQDDGSINLVNSSNEVVFVIAAPYMYDANGEESYGVEMSLTENGEQHLLTVTADAQWINSGERTFPVVIDPTAYFDFNDVFVMDGLLYEDTTRVGTELRVGRNLTNLTRTYIKPFDDINNPIIPAGCYVTDAQLILKKDSYYQAPGQDDIDIRIFDCYAMPEWTADSITWNNQPFGNTENSYSAFTQYTLDAVAADSSKETYVFDITAAMLRWEETGILKGFMLASNFEDSKTQVDFYSSRADTNHPLIQVGYMEANLSEDFVQTDSSAKVAATIDVNTSADWTATADQPWISLSTTGGSGMSSFTISVTENTSAYQREGTVMVSMDSAEIGEIKVSQSGSGAYLFLDETPVFLDYKIYSKTLTVDTNDSSWKADLEIWDNDKNAFAAVNIEDNNNSTDAWIKVVKSDDKIDLSVCKENTTANTRKARITVTAQGDSGDITKTILITQYDKVTCLFNTLNEDGSLSAISSSEYNHALATWAMELSYAAYNPVRYEAIPGIPSSFIQEPFNEEYKTAEFELESVGFDATAYNYDGGYCGYAAHTIGHRNVINENNQETGGNSDDTSIDVDVLSRNFGGNTSTVSTVEIGIGDAVYKTVGTVGPLPLNLTETPVQSINSRPLVVVIVRGSVTPLDWVIDIGNQFNAEYLNFQAGMKEVIKSLCGCTELCDECNGDGCEDASAGYLDGIEDPIIMITGHSLGAAIANLTADYLNQKLGLDNVYAYTFATPNTVNIASGDQPNPYKNVFNILNNNDAVPHFPWNLVVNEWARHGRDFHITMPLANQGIEVFDIDLLGAFGHGMPTYYAWLNNLPGELKKPAEDITVDDLNDMSVDFAIGLGAILFKVLCPVTVTLYDTDGSIIPFESLQDDAEYPKVSETGIVSWITEDGGKMFMIPYGSETIEARIVAYDYGTMDLTVEQPGLGEPLDTITYNNVNLYPDKEFKVEIAKSFDSEEVALMHVVTDENGNETETEITELNPLLKSVTVDNPNITYGTPSVFTFVTDKSVEKVQLIRSTSGLTLTIDKNSELLVSLVDDGDNLIWTVERVIGRGEMIYDAAVKVDDTWYVTENVFKLNIT